ncbi:hypothetical protein DIE03_23035 [Burkholderia sp. Bp8992]|uniref:hypothetical protein n=1 Tax=Burkholderia sp. Bp8992 TaxID=2184554 RepID=UPI000F565C60|nr:hypothetical protein [Burkholderia sp. Bp8992]RQS26705.1 hypothetical protein DIE03_23035 [Burkholderia sp. Bp8992]
MDYNICIVRPPGYVHSGAFTELAEVIAYGLEDLGHVVHFSKNDMRSDARNLLIGCHLADPAATEYVPDDTIVVNTEQIHVDEQPWHTNIYRWTSKYETWDYSARNIAKLKTLGIDHARYLTLGFHPKLRRIPSDVEQDIDPDYVTGLRAAPYDALVDTCVELVHDIAQRRRLEATALDTIMRLPQAKTLAPLLSWEPVAV